MYSLSSPSTSPSPSALHCPSSTVDTMSQPSDSSEQFPFSKLQGTRCTIISNKNETYAQWAKRIDDLCKYYRSAHLTQSQTADMEAKLQSIIEPAGRTELKLCPPERPHLTCSIDSGGKCGRVQGLDKTLYDSTDLREHRGEEAWNTALHMVTALKQSHLDEWSTNKSSM